MVSGNTGLNISRLIPFLSFCENNDDGVIKEGENLDSGFASNPNSRTGSVLCDKQPQQPASSTTTTPSSIPLPVFPMIYESDHAK